MIAPFRLLDDGIALPVADAAFFSGDGGPLSDVHAAGDQAAPGVFAFALVVFLAVLAQAAPEAAAVSLVLPDMPVVAFAAVAGLSLRPEPAAVLIGAPLVLRQFFLDQKISNLFRKLRLLIKNMSYIARRELLSFQAFRRGRVRS